MKRFLPLLCTLMVLCAALCATAAAADFDAAAQELSAIGIFRGNGKNIYSKLPDNARTRGILVAP